MKRIKLSNFYRRILVDDEDFERISIFNCFLTRTTIQVHLGTSVPLSNIIMNDEVNMYDHKDRNIFNNQKSNLRICNDSQNGANRIKQKNTSSKYKGVSFKKESNKWQARITINGKIIFLGYFKFEANAARAYDKKARELFGEFANPNFSI